MSRQRPNVDDALDALSRANEAGVSVRYAEMWLREAKMSRSDHDEERYLSRAEEQLGRALTASATPSEALIHAYRSTYEARSDAAA